MIDDKKFNRLIDAINKTAPGNGGMFMATREVRNMLELNAKVMEESTDKLSTSISELTKVLEESNKSTEEYAKINTGLHKIICFVTALIGILTTLEIIKIIL